VFRLLKLVGKSLVGFGALHLIGRLVFKNWRPSLTNRQLLYTAELMPSTVHALIVACGAWKAIAVDRAFKDDVVEPYPLHLDTMFAASAAYSMFDIGVMALHGEHVSLYWHHFAMLAGALAMPLYRRTAFFPLWFHMSELTVPIQNLIYFCQTMYPSLRLQALLDLRLLAFVALRTSLTPAMFVYLRKRGIDLQAVIDGEARPVVYISSLNVVTLTMLNLMWTVAVAKRSFANRR
jgi:hypothetical protein